MTATILLMILLAPATAFMLSGILRGLLVRRCDEGEIIYSVSMA